MSVEEKTPPPPPPRQLADMLRVHMWSDWCDDDSRLLHDWSQQTICELADRCLRLAKQLEHSQ